ncbi:MAG: cation transporter [Clostridia bacterium]
MKEVTIRVDDMHCAACSSRVEKVLNQTEGVTSANVNLATLKAKVKYNEEIVNEKDLFEVIEKAGYTPELDEKNTTEEVTFNVSGMT